MSKTTTKTETVTEEFDKDGNVTKRIRESTEETFEDTAPNYVPNPTWTQPHITWGSGQMSEVKCTCLEGSPCYKHATLINQQSTNPTSFSVSLASCCQDAVSDESIYEGENGCDDSTCCC